MFNLRLITMFAIAATAISVSCPASASETQIACLEPSTQVSTGLDGLEPRFTIQCLSTNVRNITYFAYKISQSPATAQMLQTQVNFFIERSLAAGLSPNNVMLILYTDLSNESGNSWGCGAANCRIIDYLTMIF
jgi:hypothetical protein